MKFYLATDQKKRKSSTSFQLVALHVLIKKNLIENNLALWNLFYFDSLYLCVCMSFKITFEK